MKKRIGFISFRISGTDGVSLETKKWADIFERNGHECFYFAGELDTAPERSMVVPEAHFSTPEVKNVYVECFTRSRRPPSLTEELHKHRAVLKKELYEFIRRFSLDVLIPQNVLTIPLNIPLGLALTELIAETNIPIIAHHHDFFWERKRFLTNCVWDYLNMAYPPNLPSIHHVSINTSGQHQLSLRTGIASTLIPNVMDFESPAPEIDDYSADVRAELDIPEDHILVLQPTRVVQRKGIEHAIEFVSRLKRPATFVISHASGDEGYEYQNRIKEYASLMGIRALFVSGRIDDERGETADGKKIYRLTDVYPHADIVTYPSLIEGFGNAFLETVYFRKPILVNNYSVYSHDIKPKGFRVVEMDGYITDDTVEQARKVLDDAALRAEMADTNYRLGLTYFGYTVLNHKLQHIMRSIFGELEAVPNDHSS